MPISFSCPHCGHHTNVADQYAGQSGPCAHCGETITVPSAGLQRPTPAPAVEPASRSGLPVVVIVLVAAGVGLFVCVGILTAFLLPAVSAAREAARRSVCANNLKQIGLAMLQYQNAHGTFPPAYIPDENGRPKHSWRVLLLPYLEAQHIYDQYNFDEPWDGPNNSRLANQMPPIYLCPSDADSVNQSFTSYAAVTGPGTMFEGSQAVSMSAIRDGVSMTIAVVEAAGTDINWMEPRDLDLSQAGYVVNGQTGGMESRHPGGAQAVFVDGSVHFLPASTSPQELQALTTISGGEPVAVP